MKRVYTGRNEVEAHFIRTALEAEGINAVVQGETLNSGAVPIVQESQPSVWVDDGDLQRAEEIVQTLPRPVSDKERASGTATPTWTCPRCGESIEAQFDKCWNCGADRN